MPLAAERSGLIRGWWSTSGAAPPELWGHRDCGGAIDPREGAALTDFAPRSSRTRGRALISQRCGGYSSKQRKDGCRLEVATVDFR